MRVAIFTDVYPPFVNGVATSTFNLVNCLVSHGHEVLVVTPRSTDGKLEQIGNVLYVPGMYLKKIYGYRLVVMVARGGVGNPFLITQIKTFFETGERLPNPSFLEQCEYCLELAKAMVEEKGELTAMRIYRSIAPKFFHHCFSKF